jgi:hypothetical protein
MRRSAWLNSTAAYRRSRLPCAPKRASAVPLKLVPLVKETAGPNTIYGITMGVRPNEPQWKHTINKLIAENQGEINVILQGYSVPVLDEKGNVITAAAER